MPDIFSVPIYADGVVCGLQIVEARVHICDGGAGVQISLVGEGTRRVSLHSRMASVHPDMRNRALRRWASDGGQRDMQAVAAEHLLEEIANCWQPLARVVRLDDMAERVAQALTQTLRERTEGKP